MPEGRSNSAENIEILCLESKQVAPFPYLVDPQLYSRRSRRRITPFVVHVGNSNSRGTNDGARAAPGANTRCSRMQSCGTA